ncbi:MAG: hypothetical protein KIT69_16840 [Propionibacteriaceae bacterium]|nr:hypothetical protein [Propionibacteriaceae bacterium]
MSTDPDRPWGTSFSHRARSGIGDHVITGEWRADSADSGDPRLRGDDGGGVVGTTATGRRDEDGAGRTAATGRKDGGVTKSARRLRGGKEDREEQQGQRPPRVGTMAAESGRP